MKKHIQTLYVGAPRGKSCAKTIEVITGKLRRLGKFPVTGRMLDVGSGDGTFTMVLGKGCGEVYGIDVQENALRCFREAVKDNPGYFISNMSASAMIYPDDYFDTIVTIETLEHVPDLAKACSEICRVLKRGGGNYSSPYPTAGFHLRIMECALVQRRSVGESLFCPTCRGCTAVGR